MRGQLPYLPLPYLFCKIPYAPSPPLPFLYLLL